MGGWVGGWVGAWVGGGWRLTCSNLQNGSKSSFRCLEWKRNGVSESLMKNLMVSFRRPSHPSRTHLAQQRTRQLVPVVK